MSRSLQTNFAWWVSGFQVGHISFRHAAVSLCGRFVDVDGMSCVLEVDFERTQERCDACLAMKRAVDRAAQGDR